MIKEHNYTSVLLLIFIQLLKPFLDQVLQAYISCGVYLQSKLPLESMTLQCLSAVDPIARGHSKTGHLLRRLAEMFTKFLPADVDVQQEVSWIMHFPNVSM